MKKIAILGSTGSIGTQTLSVIEEHADDFEVTALACGNNIRLLEEQMRKFRPKLVAVWSERAGDFPSGSGTANLGIPVETGMDGLLAVATSEESEILVTAIVGMLGIRPTAPFINMFHAPSQQIYTCCIALGQCSHIPFSSLELQ